MKKLIIIILIIFVSTIALYTIGCTTKKTIDNTAPTIELRIYEGPDYIDNYCVYRIEAVVTGFPEPEVSFSKDDSLGNAGQRRCQVNLESPQEPYLLVATATNSVGEDTSQILLEWGCEEDESYQDETLNESYQDETLKYTGRVRDEIILNEDFTFIEFQLKLDEYNIDIPYEFEEKFYNEFFTDTVLTKTEIEQTMFISSLFIKDSSLITDDSQLFDIDWDNDGMTNYFEQNICKLPYDIKNDRFVLTLNTMHPENERSWFDEPIIGVDPNIEDIKELYIATGIPEDNILLLQKGTGQEATLDNFKNSIDFIKDNSDENDLIYLSFEGHGCEGPPPFFCFADEDGNEQSGPNVPFSEINEMLEDINCRYMLLSSYSCALYSSMEPMETTQYPRVMLVITIREALNHIVHRNSEIDDNGDNFSSIKELFEYCKSGGPPDSNPDRYKDITISDPNNIADEIFLLNIDYHVPFPSNRI